MSLLLDEELQEMEFYAHRLIYDNSGDIDKIRNASTLKYLKKYGVKTYYPIHDVSGLTFSLITRKNKNSVLVFRGTEDIRDWIANFHRLGVGIPQYNRFLASYSRHFRNEKKLTVTGHSLGGALAQLFSCCHLKQVKNIVTFQSPGIPDIFTKKLIRFNKKNHKIISTHVRTRHDIVPSAGESFTPGTVLDIEFIENENDWKLIESTKTGNAHKLFIVEKYNSIQISKNKPHPNNSSTNIQEYAAEAIGAIRPFEGIRKTVPSNFKKLLISQTNIIFIVPITQKEIINKIINDPTFVGHLMIDQKLLLLDILLGNTLIPKKINLEAFEILLTSSIYKHQLREFIIKSMASINFAYTDRRIDTNDEYPYLISFLSKLERKILSIYNKNSVTLATQLRISR